MSMYMSVAFALVCLGVALQGFYSLGDISDAQQLQDAKGFAWFWAFLGGIGVLFGLLSRWMHRTAREDE
jgi:hypothetical protein